MSESRPKPKNELLKEFNSNISRLKRRIKDLEKQENDFKDLKREKRKALEKKVEEKEALKKNSKGYKNKNEEFEKEIKKLEKEIDAMDEEVLRQMYISHDELLADLERKNEEKVKIVGKVKEQEEKKTKTIASKTIKTGDEKKKELSKRIKEYSRKLFENPDFDFRSDKSFDIAFYNEYKTDIEKEAKELLETEWRKFKNELTPELISSAVLGDSFRGSRDPLEKKFGDLYRDEFKKRCDKFKNDLVIRKINGETLSKREDDYIQENADLRDKYEKDLEGKKNGDLVKLDEIAKRENEGKTLNKEEKDLIAKYQDIYNSKSNSFIESEKEKALELTKRVLNNESLADQTDRDLVQKYKTESMATIEAENNKIKEVQGKRDEIAELLHKGDKDGKGVEADLTPEQKIFLTQEGELENVQSRMKKLADEEQRKIKIKEDAEAKEKKVADEASSKAEREAFGRMNPEEKRKAALARYEKMVANKRKQIEEQFGTDTVGAQAEIQRLKDLALEKRNGRGDFDERTQKYAGSHDRKSKIYNQNSEGLRAILGNKEYQKLAIMDPAKMNYDQKKKLEVFKADEAKFHENLKKNGPQGNDYYELEKARVVLAKSSQDFKGSFKRKFFGSRLLAGVGNMFGFKWSGIKEGENTESAKNAMHLAQEKYQKINQKLMQGVIGEEHAVREIWKEDKNQIAIGMEGLLRNVKREFIDKEYQKLDELKHILEDSVKKPAFEQFAKWYKTKYWNSIKNERVRNVVKRLTNAVVLGTAFLPFSAAAAGAVIGSRVLRAAISGTIGESAAMGVAGIFGGAKNEKGEFARFAKMKEGEFKKSEIELVEIIQENIRTGQPPMNQALSNKMKSDHEGAIHQMQRRENRVRKGEMWARILFGGGSVYALSQLDPGGILMPGAGDNGDHFSPGVIAPPDDGSFSLEASVVPADPKGFIQTFMNLKEKVISDYSDNPEFAGLTHDQIADKLVASGKLDGMSAEIMGANSLQEFMAVAKEHGFWKPEGWNNADIDSGSVPFGSTVGMQPDGGGKMFFFIKLPDGHEIPVDNNFNEALSEHLRGVTMIDSDHLNNLNRVPGAGTTGTEAPPDTLLDESEYGVDDPNRPSLSGENKMPDKEIELKPYANSGDGLPGAGSVNELVDNASSIDQKIAAYKQFANPGDEHQFYLNKGFTEVGTQGTMRGSVEDVTTEYRDDTGINYYYTEKYSGYSKFEGGEHDIKNSPMYHEYHDLKDNYETAQQEIRNIEKQKLDDLRQRTEDNYEHSGPNQDSDGDVNGDDGSFEVTEELKEEQNYRAERWIDEAFHKDPLFGKDVEGIDTKAWARIEGDKATDFLKDNLGRKDISTWKDISAMDPDDFRDKINPDDTYSPTDNEKFLMTLQKHAHQFDVVPQDNETVSEFTKRLALLVAESTVESS